MVPLPPPARDEIVDEDLAAEHTKPCWTTTAKGGVGVVMSIFVLLALLVGIKWIHLDAAVSIPTPIQEVQLVHVSPKN